MPRLDIVIPVHNEGEGLDALLHRLDITLKGLLGWVPTLYFVNDGSTDDSMDRLRAFDGCFSKKLISLSRNFGHQSAVMAGLMSTTGDVVISMDGDLQHPPEIIPEMLDAYKSGAQVVQMVRDINQSGLKGLYSKVFYWFFKRVSKIDIVPHGPDFRLMSRDVLTVIKAIPERDKFLRALLPSLGFRQVTMPYKEAERETGEASFTFKQSLRMGVKAIFSYSTFPLRMVFYAGFLLAAVSFIGGIGHIMVKLLFEERVVPGFTDIIVSILFLSGCILGSIGILGRYIITILDELKQRPLYIIADEEHIESAH